MPELSALAWVLLGVGAALVGVSKAAIPGVNTLAIAIFATLLPAKESTGALLILLMVGDLGAVRTYRKEADWGILRRLVPTVLVGVALGIVFLRFTSDLVVSIAIGVILVGVVALGLVQRRRAARAAVAAVRRADGGSAAEEPHVNKALAGCYGVLGGFTTMVANAAGPVMSMYFLAARLNMTAFLGTAAWFFFTVNLIKLPFSIGLGLITWSSLLMDLLLVPALVAGFVLGRWLVPRIDQQLFERLVVAFTLVGAGYLLLRPLLG